MKKLKWMKPIGIITCVVTGIMAVKTEYDAQKKEQQLEELENRVAQLEKEREES